MLQNSSRLVVTVKDEQTHPVGEQQRVDRLLGKEHAIRLSAQVRELDPHDRVILR